MSRPVIETKQPFKMDPNANPLADKAKLDSVVNAIQEALHDPHVRETYSQRAVQCLVWHSQPKVSSVLSELRSVEDSIRREIMYTASQLIYVFHTHAIDVTMERAGIKQSTTVNPGSSLRQSNKDITDRLFDVFCLDSKERLYILLKEYNWIEDFFRSYPIHFYENAFQFIERIPPKGKLPVRVKVIGLGIGGSIACSGLAKYGIETVHGYEKRGRYGPRSVTSRYQNASWRAYDIAAKLVDDTAFDTLIKNRQRVLVTYDDGSTSIQTSDRVQIILGSAIDSALDSATGYGAQIQFHAKDSEYYNNNDEGEAYDIVGLFCGAHTAYAFKDCLPEVMKIHQWPKLDSKCMMWLQIKETDNTDNTYCTRGGDIGCERWHYSISSTRSNLIDIKRIQWNQQSQYEYYLQKFNNDASGNSSGPVQVGMLSYHNKEEFTAAYEKQKALLDSILNGLVQKQLEEEADEKKSSENKSVGPCFDYAFTNAPANECNLNKRQQVAEHVVLDGEYTVEVKIATNCTVFAFPSSGKDHYNDLEIANINSSSTQGKGELTNEKDSAAVVIDVDEEERQRQFLLRAWNTNVIVCGGDACVPPNPLAAYGATLACEAAGSFVMLAVAIGHLNAIANDLQLFLDRDDDDNNDTNNTASSCSTKNEIYQSLERVQYLKQLFVQYYEAHSRSENYFQWVQTVICNLYSLPPQQIM